MSSTLNTSEDSSSSKPELSTLVVDFKQILDVIKENGNKVDNIKNKLASLTARVDNLEKDH